MDKSYRIHTEITKDTLLNVNMKQDFDFLEVLSLKLSQKDAYRLHSSNYGIIVGRVLANDAFGIPNAKVSVFIKRDVNDSSDMESIYPYKEVTTKDREGRRYNLLPDYSDDDCYRVVGTFPNKRLVLDDDVQLDVYDKYWKYTTVTNNCGDYMLLGVPTGSVQVHIDMDLSDIGLLSQKPRDFEYKGYNIKLFDSPSQFKGGTNLDDLTQIFSQEKSVFVYPFWGDSDNGIAAITRSDVQIEYKFEPTCVFMGSIVSDNEGHAIGNKCTPDVENGMNNQLVGGSGTIEMIRKTTDGLIEEYQIQGNQLIDNDGVWCYQIPMNLDYIGMDEYGNIVPTDNVNKGIPTRTQVRFRISKNETSDEGFSRHTAKYLVPMNPMLDENEVIPTISYHGQEVEKMYNFGSSTPTSCFRDLYWNNVYSVKNYIPKTQVAHRAYSKNYSALKGANYAEDQNPIPFNKLNIELPFTYMIICLLFEIVKTIIEVVNAVICAIDAVIAGLNDATSLFGLIDLGLDIDYVNCIPLNGGITEGNITYFPGGCRRCMRDADCAAEMEDGCEKSDDAKDLTDKVQRNLAKEFKVLTLDFYQDWINGCLYMPLWYWRKRKKRTFLFWTINRAKNDYCSDEDKFKRLKTYVTCNLPYSDNSLELDNYNDSDKKWHKNVTGRVFYRRGLIKPIDNNDGLRAYYYAAVQATSDNDNPNDEIIKRSGGFKVMRLYATDIILLGNLDPDNIYGIPQFYTCLPSTTTNIPPFATIEEMSDENAEKDDYNKDYDFDTSGEREDSGTTLVTGMDWGDDGNKKEPKYQSGLFLDLSCFYANTKVKSCINAERLSELGVSLDMLYRMAYHNGGNLTKYGDVLPDGMITKFELDDLENRAMFATLNHIGFIPQEYQNRVDSYTTQVHDSNTNYLVPKFMFLYPTDFDGRLKESVRLYKGSFDQAMFDEKDEAYITFRLGAENGDRAENNERRIRHFYLIDDGQYSMPLYNNSYYFYFGVVKGSTAIDKFNELFSAPCVKSIKKPFFLDISRHGKSYCPTQYDAVTVNCPENETVQYKFNEKRNNAYGYIRVNSDDIKIPFSYELYDSNNILVISEDEMEVGDFVIGGKLDESGHVLTNCDGRILEQRTDNRIESSSPYYESGLTNQDYRLVITDANGKVMTETVKVSMPELYFDYDSVNLGTRFFNTSVTRIDYICNEENDFFGRVDISGVTVDGISCNITSVSSQGYDTTSDSYIINLTASTSLISNNIPLVLYIQSMSTDGTESQMRDCLCDSGNNVARRQPNTAIKINAANISEYYLGFNDGVVSIFFYQPNSYIFTLYQICDGKMLNDNAYTEVIDINNGEPFEAYLNSMPIRFMLGEPNTSTENGMAYNENSHFYWKEAVAPTNTHLIGWYGVHQEDAYQFPLVNDTYEDIWTQFIKNEIGDINSGLAKRTILKYKFKRMFELSEGAYVTNRSSRRFTYTTSGGRSPILYRSVIPNYRERDGYEYILSEENSVRISASNCNIVANNNRYYGSYNSQYDIPKFWWYKINSIEQQLRPYQGNYFAAFTKDGGYTSMTNIDDSIKIEKKPAYAAVNPSGVVKKKGQDIIVPYISRAYRVYETSTDPSMPYIRALFVDRRLDFNLMIFAPSPEKVFNLYPNDMAWKERVWRGSRVCGTIYNGIEMAYDENYNVISADCNEDSASATNRLEYSYSYRGGSNYPNAVTVYNSGATNSVWNSTNIGYRSVEDASTSPLIKQFYEFSVNGADIRNMVWSDFNKNRLSSYALVDANNSISSNTEGFYIYRYPVANSSLYNGDFNMTSVGSGTNYPTKRYLDIIKLPNGTFFNMHIASCSYRMTPQFKEDDMPLKENDTTSTLTDDSEENLLNPIKCETTEGESIDINMEFGNGVRFISANDGSNETANVSYSYIGGRFITNLLDITFTYNPFSVDGFNVYTPAPRIIQVLPYKRGNDGCDYDGISYFKSAHVSNGNDYGDTISPYDAMNQVMVVGFGNASFMDKYWRDYYNVPSSIVLPSDFDWSHTYKTKRGDEINGVFFKKNGEYLKSDDYDVTNIIFSVSIPLNVIDPSEQERFNSSGNVFTILLDRIIENASNDGLTTLINCFETSELFDCRPINMESLTESGGTYFSFAVANESTNKPPTEVVGSIDDGQVTGDTVIIETTPATITDTTKIYNQTVSFKMEIDMTEPPNSRCNEAFLEGGLMSYTFLFRDNRGEEYEITPEVNITQDVESQRIGDDTILTITKSTIIFTCRWRTNMGLLIDDNWNGGATCKLIARTSNNFIYHVGYFNLSGISGTDKEDMEDGVRYRTQFTIS